MALCTGERPLDDSKRLCAHILEKAMEDLNDECETILGIFDLRGFGTQNADFGFVRFLVCPANTPHPTPYRITWCCHLRHAIWHQSSASCTRDSV